MSDHLDSPQSRWVNSMLLPLMTTDAAVPDDTLSGSTSAPPTTSSFDMLSSLSDSSDNAFTTAGSSAPTSVQQKYLALPLASAHMHTRPGHTRRQSHSHTSQPAMPQLTRTISLGNSTVNMRDVEMPTFLYEPSPSHSGHSELNVFDAAAGVHLQNAETKPPRGPNLKRGKACSFCRQRKLRCSGHAPKCTMCIKYKREPCEYKAHSRAQSATSNEDVVKSPASPVFDDVDYPYISPPLNSDDQIAPQVLFDAGTMPMAQQLLNTPHDLYYPPFPDDVWTHRKTGSISSGMSALHIPSLPLSGPSTTTSTDTSSNSYQHRHRIDSAEPPPPGSQVPFMSDGPLYECPPPPSDVLFSSDARYTDPVQPLTRRLGEFLFFPSSEGQRDSDDSSDRIVGKLQPDDGLTDAQRQVMFDTFFPFSRLFFQMSIARFKYRMQFKDERRPSPAFLNAIYLWATRFTDQEHLSQDKLELEEKYFEAGRAAMFDQSTLPYRMLDQMRAGFLLSAYVYGGGRFHEGWMLHGIATRLATSTGLHHIESCTFTEHSATDPFMRQKRYLFPPPEDRLELAERIHTFWAVFSLDRLATCLTGFPTTIPDEAITTPLPREFDEIANGNVSSRDDYTISDLYRNKLPPERQTQYCHWLKVVVLLERVSKLAFLEPETDSLYAQYLSGATAYFSDLEQAWYRRPQEYTILLAAVTRLTTSMGADGVLPTVRLAADSTVTVPNLVIIIHHVRWAILTLLHDVNHADSPNTDALLYARQSVIMIRKMPQMPIYDIDSFAIQVWGVIARVFMKEIRRLTRSGERDAAQSVVDEVQVLLNEIKRVGVTMVVARATAQMIQEALQSAGTI